MNLFGSLAQGYAEARPPLHPLILDRVARRLGNRRFDRALDIGCGSGLSTRPLRRLAAHTFGIEVAGSMLPLAAGIAPEARFLAARAEEMPFPGGSIGLLTAAGSLNYARLDRFFPEAARVLEPDGLLVVYDFSPGREFAGAAGLDDWFAEFLRRYPWAPDEAQELNPDRLAGISDLFRLDHHEDFAIGLTLSPAFYLEYVLTETNVAYAVRRGTPIEEIRAWCAQTLAPLFGGRDREVVFRGYLAHLVRAKG